jgi:hypothetical protein
MASAERSGEWGNAVGEFDFDCHRAKGNPHISAPTQPATNN